MKDSIKNIIFDFGGVVFHIDERRTIAAFSQLLRCSNDEILNYIFHDDIFYKLECGQISFDDFRKHMCQKSNVQISEEQFLTAWNAILVGYPEEHIPLLLALKKKYRTFLLSNTNAVHTQYFSQIAQKQHLEIQSNYELFEKVYYSNELGMRKPDPNIYKYVLNDANLKAEETLFVDDLLVNVDGAKSVGINAIQVTKERGIVQIFSDWI